MKKNLKNIHCITEELRERQVLEIQPQVGFTRVYPMYIKFIVP
jgi:hypothetical protein